MATCGDDETLHNGTNACYLSNHGAGTKFAGTVTLTEYDHFGNGTGVIVTQEKFALPVRKTDPLLLYQSLAVSLARHP